MSPSAKPYTVRPPVPRIPAPQRWERWRAVIEAYVAHARQVVETGGQEFTPTPDLRHDFGALRSIPFPVEGASGEAMANAFRDVVDAFVTVALPARRVAIASAVLGCAQALEGLVLAEQSRLTDVWRTRLGAGD